MNSIDLGNKSQPLVTFVIISYNQEDYILDTVESAFAQNYSPLQIVIADDCSTDKTFEIIKQLARNYSGPHEIVPLRHEINLGVIGNLNKAMEIARGELIVALGGDDIACADRVERIVSHWIENGKCSGSIFSNFKAMDEAGNVRSLNNSKDISIVRLSDKDIDTLNTISIGTRGCAHAWTRDVFDIFGPIDPRVIHEDVSIPLRSLLIGSVTSIPDELVHYRVISGTVSRPSFVSYRDRFKKMARYWEGKVANYRQLDADIKVALQKKLIVPDDVKWLQANMQNHVALASMNFRFFNSGPIGRFLSILTASKRIPISRKLKLITIATVPWIYSIKRR